MTRVAPTIVIDRLIVGVEVQYWTLVLIIFEKINVSVMGHLQNFWVGVVDWFVPLVVILKSRNGQTGRGR